MSGKRRAAVVDENGLTARDRNMILGTGRSGRGERCESQSRGFRALRTVCEALGLNPLTVQRLRGAEMAHFQWMWTEEMMRLARTEPGPFPWDSAWDAVTRPGPVHHIKHYRRISEQERNAA